MRSCRMRRRSPRAMPQVKPPPRRFAASPAPISRGSDRVTAMRLLLTRPREDAQTLAKTLKLRGHHPVIAPLLQIRFTPGPEISLIGVQAVIATSANGVKAFAARSQNRDLPVFAVGPQTAETATQLGFPEVICAKG